MEGNDLVADLDAFLTAHEAELVEFRRDLHANPETGYNEHRTTRRVALRLAAAGLRPVILPKGTGLIVDIGTDIYAERSVVALRADIDALPMADEKNVPYASTVPGVCHACGHDVHTTILLGTGLFLAQQAAAGLLPGRVRLIFQPSEELGTGALDVLAAGGLASVGRAFALHCDPRLDAGQLGVRTGAITAACDKVTVRVSGPGGHTARPHLTADLVFALSKIITELPAALSRRVDPRSSLSLVWGHISAGNAPNAIPDVGLATGTVRCLDDEAWHGAPDLLKELIDAVAVAYGVTAELDYERNVPPTVNDPESAGMFTSAGTAVLGPGAVVHTPQSLGGEDFAWLLESVPGALARLGTRVPGSADQFDLHQPTFDVDERAIGVGVRVFAATAITALWDDAAAQPAPPSRTSDGYPASRSSDGYPASRTSDGYPADAYPSQAYSSEAYKPEAHQPDAYLADSYPSDAYPSDVRQPEAYPADAYASDARLADGYASDARPSDAYASDARPSDARPVAASASADLYQAAPHPSDLYPASARPSEGYPASARSSEGYPASVGSSEGYSASARSSEGYPAPARFPEAYPPARTLEADPRTRALEAYPVSSRSSAAYAAPAPRAIEAHPSARALEAYPTSARALEAYPAPVGPSEAYPVSAHSSEAYPSGAYSANGYTSAGHPSSSHSSDAHPPNGYTSDPHPPNGHPSDAYQVNGHSSDAYPVNGHPSDAYPVNAYPASAKPQQYRQPRQYRQPQSPRAVGA